MKPRHRIIVGAGIATILLLQVCFLFRLERPDGIRISFPYVNAKVPRGISVTGDAWMRGGIDTIDVILENRSDRSRLIEPGVRARVTYKGKTIFQLAAYRADIEIPSDGEYLLSAVVHGPDGEVTTVPRAITVRGDGKTEELGFLSAAHIIPLILIVGLAVLVPLLIKKIGTEKAKEAGAVAISLVFYIDEIIYQLFWYGIGAWTVTDSIMIHMCGLAVMLTPVMYFTENKRVRQFMFDVLYFWGLGGAVQALLTPYVGLHVFPSVKYFGYFISHGTIVISVIYMTVVYGMDLNFRSLLRALGASFVGGVTAYGLNMVLRFVPPYEPGNYWMMGYPPPTGSVIDIFAEIFGPTPRYGIGLLIMTVVVFTLLWLPFPIRRKLKRKKN